MVLTATARRVAHENPVADFIAVLVAIMADLADMLPDLRSSADPIAESALQGTRLEQSLTAKTIGKTLVTIGLVVVVLNEVFSINAINNSTGPFASVVDTVENLGIAALTILTVGVIILAGAVAMNFMDRF